MKKVNKEKERMKGWKGYKNERMKVGKKGRM